MNGRFPWKSALLILLLIGIALAAPYLPIANPLRMSFPKRLALPSWYFPRCNDAVSDRLCPERKL